MRAGVLAILVGLAFASVPLSAYADASGDNTWHGNAPVMGGKAYLTTPLGQLHYRDVGPHDGKTPFLLLHQSPWSMIEFADIQNDLAAQGYRAITVDTPGNGMSDAPKGKATIEGFADNLVVLLDALKIQKVVLGGHHTGASIAVAFAARHPERVAGLIIHGVPLYTAAERAEHLAAPSADRTLKADGSHLSDYYKGVMQRTANPPKEAFTNMRVATLAVLDLYKYDRDIGHEAAFSYDLQPDLMKIKAPTLVMSDAGDTLADMDVKAAKLRPDFTFREFSKGSVLTLMSEPKRWADIAIDFAKTKAGK